MAQDISQRLACFDNEEHATVRSAGKRCRLQLCPQWTALEVCSVSHAPELVTAGSLGAVLQGAVSSTQGQLKPGSWLLGSLDVTDGGCPVAWRPRVPVRAVVLAAPERPEREDLPKYDRAALVEISEEGMVQLGGVAWLCSEKQRLQVDADILQAGAVEEIEFGCRRSGNFIFCEGILSAIYSQGEDGLVGILPADCRPHGARRCYLSLCVRGSHIHILKICLDAGGRLWVRRSHVQGRARDGHTFEVQQRNTGPLEASLGAVRFLAEPGQVLELLAGARPPRQHAARKQLAYLGLKKNHRDPTEGNDPRESSPNDLDGYQVATCTRHNSLVLLDGAVILSARHRYTAFAKLPPDCCPDERITLLVARGLPGGRMWVERLDVTPEGECLCPQLPEEVGPEHAIHLSGAVFGVSCSSDEQQDSATHSQAADSLERVAKASNDREPGTADADAADATDPDAWTRLRELEARDRRFRGKLHGAEDLKKFEEILQWFRAHDCTESHRLTHSCFKGRSDFTQTGMLVFDTEEDLEGLNQAIAWLYERRIPVVLMERQTRIFPLIFDIDLKCTTQDIMARVPGRIKNGRPWRGPIDFCRWPGADFLVLEDLMLLRHMGLILFQFFPDLPLIDICVFNATGWDHVKEFVKVSIHLVCPYVLVTADRLTAIRERTLEYFGECSEYEGHPLASLLNRYLQEDADNTWDKVIDQTVTSGTNGLRMPFCDKATRCLKREFVERKRRGEVFTERELMDAHAYVREESGRPCTPEGILRIHQAKTGINDDFALPEAHWICKGEDLPIDEWIRLGRCRYAWRLPLAPPGPTPWRPPLCYQWAEPAALWENRVQLKGSPVVRRFSGSVSEFQANWDQALYLFGKLQGTWLASSADARWRGGLREDSTHEVRYLVRAARVVLLLSPEPGAALVFAEFRRVLAGWTCPDDYHCVPICGAPSDTHSSALHTIVAPSADFPDIQAALDAVPEDEPLHRVMIRAGTHELSKTLFVRTPVLLEGEGRWATTLKTSGDMPVLRLEGPGACSAMIRNLHLQVQGDEQGASTGATVLEIIGGSSGGEPAIVGCMITAAGRWGTCIRAVGGSPQIVRSRFSLARWGVVLVNAAGRIEDNDFRGLGPGVLVASDCRAVLETNDIRDCLSGVRIIGKRAEIQMRGGNRLLHNGLCDEHQLEAPPGVIPTGATQTVRSCRPYSFLPKDEAALLQRLRECREDHVELAILVRAARRRGRWAEAAKAHRRLAALRRAAPKAPAPSASPAAREVVVASKSWDGVGSGYSETCVAVVPGTLCEVLRKDQSGWILVDTSINTRGWCSPHVFN